MSTVAPVPVDSRGRPHGSPERPFGGLFDGWDPCFTCGELVATFYGEPIVCPVCEGAR